MKQRHIIANLSKAQPLRVDFLKVTQVTANVTILAQGLAANYGFKNRKARGLLHYRGQYFLASAMTVGRGLLVGRSRGFFRHRFGAICTIIIRVSYIAEILRQALL
jgi:hypothetical protein